MKTRTRFLVIALLALAIIPIAAQDTPKVGILDLGIRMPVFQTGTLLDDTTLNNDSETPTVIPVPFVTLGARHQIGTIHLGYGARLFGILVFNFAYPITWIETQTRKVELQAGLGGLGFAVFGFIPDTNAIFVSPTIIPEFTAHYKLTNTLRLGGGAKAILTLEEDKNNNYLIYLEAKARIPF